MLFGTRKYPKGPGLKRLEAVTANVSGTTIHYDSPYNNHPTSPGDDEAEIHFNLYDPELYGRYFSERKEEPLERALQYKFWRFYGIPMFDSTGVLGDIRFTSRIAYMPEFTSLFHPQNLICAIERYLYSANHFLKEPSRNRRNWQLVTLPNSGQWINYECVTSEYADNNMGLRSSIWQQPISDQHMLTINFEQIIRLPRTTLDKLFAKYIQTVMESVELRLSDDALTQKAAITKVYPNERLPESLPPYEFEKIETLDEYHMCDKISAQFNHDPEKVSGEPFLALVDDAMAEQQQRVDEVKARVLARNIYPL